jgi:all-trans-retinol 13,14-reductase
MRKEWDTIVVGAGIGGLTAAAKLVREGQRVLVLDRNPHPGGTAYVYRRKGFAFPMGPLGFSHPERIKSILSDLGEDEPLHLFRVHYRIKAFNLDLPLSLPSSQMVRELSAFFPSDAQGVARFFQDIERTLSAPSLPLNISMGSSKTGGCVAYSEVLGHRNPTAIFRFLRPSGT